MTAFHMVVEASSNLMQVGLFSTRIYKGDEVAEMMPENKTKQPTWKRLATY